MDETLLLPVGQIAAERPELLPVLERLGLDYCCGGDKSVKDACLAAGVNPDEALQEFEAAAPITDDKSHNTDWTKSALSDLCDHIEQTHHAFLREQLPLISGLIEKVVAAHGEAHPELHQVRDTFAALRAELEPHMMKEEQILFPALRALESAKPTPSFPFGTVGNPINMMEHEHQNAGDGLRRLRELTDGYRFPQDACSAYQGLLVSLERLEADLHEHIHKENNILFPRALTAEQGASV